MIWIILSISIAFLKALSELSWKIFISEKWESSLDEYSLALWVRSIVIIPVFLVCISQGFRTDIWPSFFLIISCWFLSAAATITAFKALKYGELSIVWPLGSLTTPLMLITSYFITREVPNIYGVTWVLIIFIGTYFLGVDIHKKGILLPLKNIFSNPWAIYMLATAFIWSLTAPLDKLWVTELGTFHWLLYLNIFSVLFLLLYMWFMQKRINFAEVYSVKNIQKIWTIALIMGLWNILQLIAIKYTLVVYVAAIKRASWVFSVLFWALYFQEKNIAWKLFAVSLMIVWVVCIILWGNI